MIPVRAVLVVGCPGSGKTTKALELAREEIGKSGRPLLVLDPGRVKPLEEIPEAEDIRELVYAVWDRGAHCRYCPDAEAEWDKVWDVIRKLGRMIVLVDEARYFMSAYRLSLPAVLATRILRHLEVSVILTTQSYGDIPRGISSIAGELYVYRCTAPRDLERLKEDHALDPAEISTLEQFKFKYVKVGF